MIFTGDPSEHKGKKEKKKRRASPFFFLFFFFRKMSALLSNEEVNQICFISFLFFSSSSSSNHPSLLFCYFLFCLFFFYIRSFFPLFPTFTVPIIYHFFFRFRVSPPPPFSQFLFFSIIHFRYLPLAPSLLSPLAIFLLTCSHSKKFFFPSFYFPYLLLSQLPSPFFALLFLYISSLSTKLPPPLSFSPLLSLHSPPSPPPVPPLPPKKGGSTPQKRWSHKKEWPLQKEKQTSLNSLNALLHTHPLAHSLTSLSTSPFSTL